jgi:hypothetical protein
VYAVSDELQRGSQLIEPARIRCAILTLVTAVSRARDAPPPNDKLAILGRPEVATELRTKSKPEILPPKHQLFQPAAIRAERTALNMSETEPLPAALSTFTAIRFAAYNFQRTES